MSEDQQLRFTISTKLFDRSRRHLAGGVSSAMRAASKPQPLFFQSGAGSHLVDVDGQEYIDYTLAWGPLILGHSHPAVLKAVQDQLSKSQLLGAQTELEISVAERICNMVPCAELVAFGSTGSEAVQMALRLARAFTGRRRFIRFEGHYHGWYDNVLVGYHPGGAPQGKGDLPTITEGMGANAGEDVIALPWNDLAALEAALKQAPNEIAAIITEPILCNRCCLMPTSGYLEGMRRLATLHNAVLIFDEVITGFRVARGGAQELFGVVPDLATFGKAVAGGFPLSVVAGKREIMELIERRRVLHAGTFNGNPVSLAAAEATLDILNAEDGSALKKVESNGQLLMQSLRNIAATAGVPILVNGVGSAFHLAFTTQPELLHYRDTLECDLTARDQFLEAMLFRGIYLLPDGRWYVSTAHTQDDLEATVDAVRKVLVQRKPEFLAVQAR